jgi:hypothetical protein
LRKVTSPQAARLDIWLDPRLMILTGASEPMMMFDLASGMITVEQAIAAGGLRDNSPR